MDTLSIGDRVEVVYPAKFAGRVGTIIALNVEFAGMCCIAYEHGGTGQHFDVNLTTSPTKESEG